MYRQDLIHATPGQTAEEALIACMLSCQATCEGGGAEQLCSLRMHPSSVFRQQGQQQLLADKVTLLLRCTPEKTDVVSL